MDVEQYLARIGFDAPRAVDLATLERLQRAHLTTVPFENLDVYYHRGVHTDSASSVRKIVERKRGGWCFELNGAFAALLEELGFTVTRLGAVVLLEGDDGQASHLTLRVDLDRPYLVDVGFGDGFVTPLPLDDPGPHDGGCSRYTFASSGDWTTLIELGQDGSTRRIYRFAAEPRSLASFAGQSERLQTDPTLKWTRSRFATRLLDNGTDRVTLIDDRLRLRRAGVWVEQTIRDEHWPRLLHEWFDLSIG